MLPLSRFASILILLLVLGGCAGTQSEITQSPESVAPSDPLAPPKASPQGPSKAAQEQPPQGKVPPVPIVPNTSTKPDSSAPKPQASSQTEAVAKAPPVPKPQPQALPKLSEKEQKLVSQVTEEVQKASSVSIENTGLVTVNRVLIAQQAMWLLSGSFSTDFKALEPNLPMETEEYRFAIPQGDESQTVVQAIAKTDKLHSFSGVAVAVPTQVPQSALCRTKIPSQTPPQPPTVKDGQVTCSNDGVLVDI